jgi:hypothetical protein
VSSCDPKASKPTSSVYGPVPLTDYLEGPMPGRFGSDGVTTEQDVVLRFFG